MIPSVSEIPSLLETFRHLRKSRSISIGPQSEADAYETLAYREKRRRESTKERKRGAQEPGAKSEKADYFGVTTSNSASKRPAEGFLPTPPPSGTNLHQSMIEAETALYTPSEESPNTDFSRHLSVERRRQEKEERDLFSTLEKPRVRYDVEVVTKLIVYTGKNHTSCTFIIRSLTWKTGVAWIAVEATPILFEITGLGLGVRPG